MLSEADSLQFFALSTGTKSHYNSKSQFSTNKNLGYSYLKATVMLPNYLINIGEISVGIFLKSF